MKKILLVLAIVFLATQSFSQRPPNVSLDSMKTALLKANDDTNKVKSLMTICQLYWSVNPPEGIKYGEQALALSEKLKWKIGMTRANGVLGTNYIFLSDYPKAEQYLQKALQLSKETNNLQGMARCYGSLSNIYYYQSKFPQALEYNFKSLKVSEQLQDKMAQAACLSNIGTTYMDLEKYPEALNYFQKAVKLNEETGFKIYQIANLGNIGIVYNKLSNINKSREYHLKALSIAEQVNDKPGIANANTNIGGSYKESGDISKALEYVFKALNSNIEMGDKSSMAIDYNIICDCYLSIVKTDNKDELIKRFGGNKINCVKAAKNYADSSVTIFTEIKSMDQLKNSYKFLSEAQSLLGDDKEALISYQKYAALRDSVFNTEKDKKLTQTAMQYEFDKKEATTKSEQEKKDIKQRNIRNSISTGFAGAMIFLIVVYRQRNKIKAGKKRSDELLLNILPAEVAEELKAKGSAEAKQFDEVTVMFTDFKGFTQISEKLTPTELVNEIHTCFKAFDHIISKYNIEKIKTIGDSYMCAGGLPVVNKTNAEDVVNAAMEIQKFMVIHKSERETKNLPVFEIRIGINTGAVVAGIVGVKKFAYDIWGDTVNIASRMESSGEAGKVNISGSTYELIKDKFNCIHRGKVQAKNKGEIDMYFVESAM